MQRGRLQGSLLRWGGRNRRSKKSGRELQCPNSSCGLLASVTDIKHLTCCWRRCVAGASLADARYFVRGVRESSHMIMSLAATYCGAPLWSSAALASALVPALGSHLAYLDYSQLRLLHRHVFHAWAVHCPAELQGQWVLPICRVVLPSMNARLTADWAANLSSGDTGAAGGGPGGAVTVAGAESGLKASEEVLNDALLRECTREHMALLLLFTRPPGTPDPMQLPKAQRQSSNGSSAAAGSSGAGAPGGAALGASSPSQGQAVQGGGAGAEVQAHAGPAVLDVLLRNDPHVAEAAMRTALLGLCWPDSESAAKAAGVCR